MIKSISLPSEQCLPTSTSFLPRPRLSCTCSCPLCICGSHVAGHDPLRRVGSCFPGLSQSRFPGGASRFSCNRCWAQVAASLPKQPGESDRLAQTHSSSRHHICQALSAASFYLGAPGTPPPSGSPHSCLPSCRESSHRKRTRILLPIHTRGSAVQSGHQTQLLANTLRRYL